MISEERCLLDRLDPFGDDLQAQIMSHRDDGVADGRIRWIGADVIDK